MLFILSVNINIIDVNIDGYLSNAHLFAGFHNPFNQIIYDINEFRLFLDKMI